MTASLIWKKAAKKNKQNSAVRKSILKCPVQSKLDFKKLLASKKIINFHQFSPHVGHEHLARLHRLRQEPGKPQDQRGCRPGLYSRICQHEEDWKWAGSGFSLPPAAGISDPIGRGPRQNEAE